MRKVGTAILKNQLSAYLQKVKAGAGFIVTDRGQPIAKLVPLDGSNESRSTEELLLGLAHEGMLRPAKNSKERFASTKKIILKDNIASTTLRALRDE